MIIDSTDNVQFWSFRKGVAPGRTLGAYYPPELLHVRNWSPTINEADFLDVTPKTGIFHLGLLLWLMAENKPRTRTSPVCMRLGCRTRDCNLSHTEPVDLPPLSESVQLYYRNIIKLCRAEKPNDRPAARELLGMFPNASNVQEQLKLPEEETSGTDTLGYGLRLGYHACNVCGNAPLQLPLFRCNLCKLGDFDLCQTCYEGGAHCHEDNHLLAELGKDGSLVVSRRYHSCVKSSGTREVIDL